MPITQPDTYQRNPQLGDLKIYTFEVELTPGQKRLFQWDGPARELHDVTDNVPTDPEISESREKGRSQFCYVAADGQVMVDRTVSRVSHNGLYQLNETYASSGVKYVEGVVKATGEPFEYDERYAYPAAEIMVIYPKDGQPEPVFRLDKMNWGKGIGKHSDDDVVGYTYQVITPTEVRPIYDQGRGQLVTSTAETPAQTQPAVGTN